MSNIQPWPKDHRGPIQALKRTDRPAHRNGYRQDYQSLAGLQRRTRGLVYGGHTSTEPRNSRKHRRSR